MPPRRTSYAKGDFYFVDVHVGSRLRRRRELLGIKIQRFAAIAGVCFQQIQKYERAENRISPGRLYQFAKALKVPVTWFFDGVMDRAERYDSIELAMARADEIRGILIRDGWKET